ncbi:uncharacterized protein [Triticum aestivum]|uniref:uncharacterized protein n=1 Tax=Triticum aestivum TaxID=4565 RepID=UPI001D00F0F6|nr:uncharacterized protein LOC123089281 [Triticum aestivum]
MEVARLHDLYVHAKLGAEQPLPLSPPPPYLLHPPSILPLRRPRHTNDSSGGEELEVPLCPPSTPSQERRPGATHRYFLGTRCHGCTLRSSVVAFPSGVPPQGTCSVVAAIAWIDLLYQ